MVFRTYYEKAIIVIASLLSELKLKKRHGVIEGNREGGKSKLLEPLG